MPTTTRYHPIVIQHTLEHAINVSLKWFDDNFMVANPNKFQAMFLGRHDLQLEINVHSSEIAVQSSVKLLGIQIDNKLAFNDHVSSKCKKSGNVINVMNRLGSLLDRNYKMRIYDSFYLSNFNYCPLIYSMQNRRNDKKIETLNRRMLRIVCNDRISYNVYCK